MVAWRSIFCFHFALRGALIFSNIHRCDVDIQYLRNFCGNREFQAPGGHRCWRDLGNVGRSTIRRGSDQRHPRIRKRRAKNLRVRLHRPIIAAPSGDSFGRYARTPARTPKTGGSAFARIAVASKIAGGEDSTVTRIRRTLSRKRAQPGTNNPGLGRAGTRPSPNS